MALKKPFGKAQKANYLFEFIIGTFGDYKC